MLRRSSTTVRMRSLPVIATAALMLVLASCNTTPPPPPTAGGKAPKPAPTTPGPTPTAPAPTTPPTGGAHPGVAVDRSSIPAARAGIGVPRIAAAGYSKSAGDGSAQFRILNLGFSSGESVGIGGCLLIFAAGSSSVLLSDVSFTQCRVNRNVPWGRERGSALILEAQHAASTRRVFDPGR